MNRKIARLAALVLLASLALSGCGASKSAASMTAGDSAYTAPQSMPHPESDYGGLAQDATAGEGTAVGGNATLRESKLIRTASMEVQTTGFDEACKALDALRDRCGGYYETANISGGEYGVKNGNRDAYYTVRVPKEQYETFMNAVGEVGHVVSRGEGQEDVGDQYHDAELRLATQRTKYERLLTLLNQADKMEDIISLENAISETAYQIDQYTADLKRYDSLVDFATIEVRLCEVVAVTDRPGEAETLSVRLGKALTGGFSDFGSLAGNFFVWCAYNLIGIVIFLAVAAIGVTVVVRKLKRHPEPSTSEEQGEK